MHTRRPSSSPRKPARSSEPLASLDQSMINGAHSLAHELAVALMPEPGGGSRMLAEEFGLEYDEHAQGMDADHDAVPRDAVRDVHTPGDSLAEEMGGTSLAAECTDDAVDGHSGDDSSLEHVSMDILAHNSASTDELLVRLSSADGQPPVFPSHAHTTSTLDAVPSIHVLETLASDMVLAINNAAKEREGQVRALVAYDLEFRRIASEVGGNDVLGELEDIDLGESEPGPARLDAVPEEDDVESSYAPSQPSSPQKAFFPAAQACNAAAPLPHLVQLRTHTAALLSTLTTISEQAQVNGAATADSGRRIRALKSRVGGLRGEWEGAERSRGRIERWEQAGGNLNGRRIVEEHLRAFQQAVEEAGLKTQAIMAR